MGRKLAQCLSISLEANHQISLLFHPGSGAGNLLFAGGRGRVGSKHTPEKAMTPKQAAAKLLLQALDQGKSPASMSREEMATALAERVSEVKHTRILEFVTKISTPFRERLTKIAGEVDKDEAAAGTTGE